jgi:hypothetical protein
MLEEGKIRYCADGVLLDSCYKDITAYHGGRYPAGTALAYQALSLAQELMFPDGGFFERGKCSVETAFMGSGFMDAVEMILRCRSLGLYKADPEITAPEGTPPAPVTGKFFYRFIQRDGVVELALKPGIVPQEFYEATEDLHAGRILSEDGVLKLRRDIEKTILSMDPGDIFDVHTQMPCTADSGEGQEPPSLKDENSLLIEDYGEFLVNAGQLRRYHGDESLCGLCLAWALVRQWAAEHGFSKKPIPRGKVTIKSGASGKGIDDAMEFLFRISGGNRYSVDTQWGESLRAPEVLPGAGFFIFGLSLEDSSRDIFILRDELVPRDYLMLCKARAENPRDFKEAATLKSLQRCFARQILSEAAPFRIHND